MFKIYKLDSSLCIKQVENYEYTPATFKVFADHILPMQVPGLTLSLQFLFVIVF